MTLFTCDMTCGSNVSTYKTSFYDKNVITPSWESVFVGYVIVRFFAPPLTLKKYGLKAHITMASHIIARLVGISILFNTVPVLILAKYKQYNIPLMTTY